MKLNHIIITYVNRINREFTVNDIVQEVEVALNTYGLSIYDCAHEKGIISIKGKIRTAIKKIGYEKHFIGRTATFKPKFIKTKQGDINE